MPRKIAFSAKKKRVQIQQKRALKRGDSPPPPEQPRGRKSQDRAGNASSSERLQSSFVKLPAKFLEETTLLAASLPLVRPIPPDAAALLPPSKPTDEIADLTCPKRPKWRYDMSKKEVEKNEEGLFKTWLEQTDNTVNAWCAAANIPQLHGADAYSEIVQPSADKHSEPRLSSTMPHAPTSFERNLEVWRQLWRVTEISQILLILLDSRCPTLHYPPSLHAYLSSSPQLTDRTRVILVLTKVDISGPARAEAWTAYLRSVYPDLTVVQVESYAKHAHEGEGHTPRKTLDAHLPLPFRKTLVDALREAHQELLRPSQRIRDDPEKVKMWKPSVKETINWDAVLTAEGGLVGSVVGGATAPRPKQSDPDVAQGEDEQGEQEEERSEFLTIGLIGQPNVGKSSLLNALFGAHKVKASRTPGKTKHFQTLFWTSDVRLVDCPGLVMPGFLPMETQVLSGILPISRVSAAALCIHHAGQLLPLEQIFGLTHPSVFEPTPEDKRTWRGARPASAAQPKETHWTAMDVLVTYALKKGWLTARTGRPDINRAGNAILRALAEGRVRWAFWPPGTDAELVRAHQPREGCGIWIPRVEGDAHEEYDESGDDAYVGQEEREDDALPEQDSRVRFAVNDHVDSLSEDEDEDEGSAATRMGGRFGVLNLGDGDESEESEQE